MARRGSFSSPQAPPSDLSIYGIGSPPQAPPLSIPENTAPPSTQDWYSAPPPPPRPTVAPDQGVLPQPVIPQVVVPNIYLTADTRAAREAIRARALAAGLHPTTAGINATYAKDRAAALAAQAAAGG